MNLLLQRETTRPATTGRLSIDGAPECDSLELPWVENARRISCIPAGRYKVTLRYSDKFRRITLHIEAVPNRDGILIHPANRVDELLGCVALGSRLSADTLMESKKAVERVEAKVRGAVARGEPVTIEIKNPEAV